MPESDLILGMSPLVFGVVCGVVGLLFIIHLFMAFYTVQEKTAAVIQRLGKFKKISTSGLCFKIPWLDWVAGRVNLRIQQLPVEVETKTLDNVFVKVVASVQYFVLPADVRKAFYELDDPTEQIESYVFDVIRARVPQMKLDEVFENKDAIADAVKKELSEVMDDYGYGIVKALVTDIDPNEKVKNAMNEINEAERLRVAAEEKGEAEKILQVKKAEAEAESKKLQGEGIANQRKAIADGLRQSIETVQEGVPEVDANEILTILLATQYFDTLEAIGKTSQTNTVLLPHSPGGLTDVMNQLRGAMIAADRASSTAGNGKDKPSKDDVYGLAGGK